MKELFDHFPRIKLKDAKRLNLIDTCFLIYLVEHSEHLEELTGLPNEAMTTFNIQEIVRVEHRLHRKKSTMRKFLKKSDMEIVEIDVNPGDTEGEKKFVLSVDPDILKYCPDPSDAVLLAVAIKTNSSILTRDKHHLFNAALENFASKYNIRVYKELKDVL